MFHYVYVLESQETAHTYVVYCTNPRALLKEHNSGKSTYTKKYMPWCLIHFEAYLNRIDKEHY